MSTLASIRTDVRSLIRQQNVDNSSFPNADGLDTFINEAIRYLGSLIEYPRGMVQIAAVVNQPNYTINANSNRIISILSAYFGSRTIEGDIRQIALIKEQVLGSVNPSWYQTVSSNNGRPNKIILFDRDTIWCDPKPDSTYSASGYNFYLLCSKVPADLSIVTESPDLPLAYHDCIAYHAGGIALISIGEQDKGSILLSQFETKRKELEGIVVKESEQSMRFEFTSEDPTNYIGTGSILIDESGFRLTR